MSRTVFRPCPFCGAEMGRTFCDTPDCALSMGGYFGHMEMLRREWAAHKPHVVRVTWAQLLDAFEAAYVVTEAP